MHAGASRIVIAFIAALLIPAGALADVESSGDWTPAHRVESIPGTDPSFNGPAIDGCPFVSTDGLSFYMASNRDGGLGGIDIWIATRATPDEPWGAPVNAGAPINSTANDFCPTPTRSGHLFYFVSNRDGGCGGDDIYVTRLELQGWGYSWGAPTNLGCQINSAGNEASPFPLIDRDNTGDWSQALYFSSNRLGGFASDPVDATLGDSDIYMSSFNDGAYGPAELAAGVNSPFEDGHPNISHDGIEMFMYSNRPGTLGMADIYVSTRSNASDPWSTPANLGSNVNSADGAETRPSLSWDKKTLYFGSSRAGGEGSSDHYVTHRWR